MSKSLKQQDFESHVGKRINGWDVLGVIVSRAETKKPVYFRARCVECSRVDTPNARAVLNHYLRSCEKCSALQLKPGRKRALMVHRPHQAVTVTEHGQPEVMCSRCWMRPGWPGWNNPCGRPVVAA